MHHDIVGVCHSVLQDMICLPFQVLPAGELWAISERRVEWHDAHISDILAKWQDFVSPGQERLRRCKRRCWQYGGCVHNARVRSDKAMELRGPCLSKAIQCGRRVCLFQGCFPLLYPGSACAAPEQCASIFRWLHLITCDWSSITGIHM